MSNEEKIGLAPLVVGTPKILVLGSLPSDKTIKSNKENKTIQANKTSDSEKIQENSVPKYYCSSSNRFWKVVAALQGGISVPVEYSQKVELLASTGIALWDVYKRALREGSLDKNIRKGEINNFCELVDLLNENSGIQTIVFNGKKASKAFSEKLRYKLLAKLKNRPIKFLSLPSTSGASRKKTVVLIQEWIDKLENV